MFDTRKPVEYARACLSATPQPPLPQAPTEVDILIERCLAGDQFAWDAVVRLYWRRVFNVAYKFVGRHDEAEDLTQDIFLKVFRSLHTFDRRANFQTWLISVSRNLCIDHYRSVRKEREKVDRNISADDLSPVSTEISPLGALERADRLATVREALVALKALSEDLHEAVVLRDIHELAYLEIAERLGCPEGTVKSRINRGRKELARILRRRGVLTPSAARAGGSGASDGAGA